MVPSGSVRPSGTFSVPDEPEVAREGTPLPIQDGTALVWADTLAVRKGEASTAQ